MPRAGTDFRIDGLLTAALGGGQQDMFCSAAQYALPLSGMLWMYLLMNASHSAPWLKRAKRSDTR
jgi:hypothetical protein